MAKSPDSPKRPVPPPATDPHTAPAQHIWLAGLGAMAKAQEQGTKAMEALVNEGLAFQRKSQAEAQQRLQEATDRLAHIATDLGQQGAGRVDRLEHLFEDRVAKALHRLGMPTLQELHLLTARVSRLEDQLAQALKDKPAVKRAARVPVTPPEKTAASSRPAKAAKPKTAAPKAAGRTAS